VVTPFISVEVIGGAIAEVDASQRNKRRKARLQAFAQRRVTSRDIVGSDADGGPSAEWRSSTAPPNGLLAVWDEGEECTVTCSHPDLAIIWVGVWNPSRLGRPTLLAYEAFPVSLARPGFRSLRLRGKSGKHVRFCKVLVQAQMRQVPHAEAGVSANPFTAFNSNVRKAFNLGPGRKRRSTWDRDRNSHSAAWESMSEL